MKTYGADKNKITQALKSGEITIAVYGLGKIGLSFAAVFADCGARVIGADVNPDVVDSVNCGNYHAINEPGLAELVKKNVVAGRLSATSNSVDAAKQADVMVIFVPTFLYSENKPDLSIVKSVCIDIAKGLDKGDIVIQGSSVPPRTTSDLILPILEESGLKRGQFGAARCPERAMFGRLIQDITGIYPQVVGGVDDASTQAAAAIYSVINSNGVMTVSDSTTAEAVKLFSAEYRDVNIALANELAVICNEFGINAMEVFEVANTNPYTHIHMPGCGVGGHCVPVCPYLITSTVKSDTRLLTLARQINDGMGSYTVDLMSRGLRKVGVELKDANVLVMGVTYRGDLKDVRRSPAILIIGILIEKCSDVYAYDPMLRDEVGQYGAKVVGDLSQVGEDFQLDSVIIACDHTEFKDIDWNDFGRRMRHKVIVDGRQCLDVLKMRNDGWTIYGIGTQP